MTDGNGLFSLPRAWIRTMVGEIGLVISGATPKEVHTLSSNGPIPYFKVGDMNKTGNERYMIHSQLSMSDDDAKKLRLSIQNTGTIIFPKRGGAIATNKKRILPQPSAFDLNIMGITPLIIPTMFLYYWITSIDLAKLSDGSNVPQINHSDIEPLMFPLPPLAEQQRIVTKIEELFTKLDDGVEELKKVQLQLKRYRQSVLKSAFDGTLTAEWREEHKAELEPASMLLEKIKTERKKSGKYKELAPLDTADLPELPEGWAWIRVGEVSEINPKLESELANSTEISFLPMRSVEAMTGKIDLSIIKPYEEVKKGFTHFQNGDLLFAKITPCMENGKAAVVNNLKNGIGFGSTEFHVIRPFGQISSILLFYYATQESFRQDARQQMTGTAGQLRVPSKYLAEVIFPLAPLSEQLKIVEEIEHCLSVVDEIEKAVEVSLMQSERLRQSILKQAFEGKLVSQDPEDEPADKLLERIKAEKLKTQANAKRGRAINVR